MTPYAAAMSITPVDAPSPINWAGVPSPDDVPKAAHFLSLLGVEIAARGPGQNVLYPAKDLLRAMGVFTPPLDRGNPGVKKYLERFKEGTEVDPCLIVPGELMLGFPLLVPEGFHRVCAAYHLAEDTSVATSRIWLAP